MNEARQPIDLTQEHARHVLRDHISMIAQRSYKLYGAVSSIELIERLLGDRDIIRYETKWRFDSSLLQAGECAMAVKEGDGFVIAVHPWFAGSPGEIPYLIAYHLATVNYGEGVIGPSEAELFGSALLGLGIESYYQRLCDIVDQFLAADFRK